MEIKVIDGKFNRFVHRISKESPIFVCLQYGEKLYKTRPSAFQKGEYFPVWNHKFFVPIYTGISDFELTITEGDDEIIIGETITNTFELMDMQQGLKDGAANWFVFNHPDSGEMVGKILVRVKFRNPEN